MNRTKMLAQCLEARRERTSSGPLAPVNAQAQSTTRLGWMAFLSALLACGGGGGLLSNDAFSISPIELSFEANIQVGGYYTRPFSITGRSGETYTSFLYDVANSPIRSVTVDEDDPNRVDVTVKPPGEVGPGDYSSTLLVMVCADPDCHEPLAGSPKAVNIRYHVASPVTISPRQLAFSSTAGESAPPPQQLSFSSTLPGADFWRSSVAYDSGGGWLEVKPSGNLPESVSVGVKPLLAAGTYRATLRIISTVFWLDIPISYTVQPSP